MLRCITRRMNEGTGHEHISHFGCVDDAGMWKSISLEQLVLAIQMNPPGHVYVVDEAGNRGNVVVMFSGEIEYVKAVFHHGSTFTLLDLSAF